MTSRPGMRAAQRLDTRQLRLARRLAPGGLDGRTELAQPIPSPPRAERYLAPGGATPRTANISVAASNASEAEKLSADYLCTGTNDEVVIQLAFDAATTNETGVGGRTGIVHFSGGVYSLAGDVTIPEGSFWMKGSGFGSYFTGTGDIVVATDVSYLSISDLYWNAGDVVLGGGVYSVQEFQMERVVLTGVLRGDDLWKALVSDCILLGGVDLTHTSLLGTSPAFIVLADNIIDGGVSIDGGSGHLGYVVDVAGNAAEPTAWRLAHINYLSMVGNVGWGAVDLDTIDEGVVSGNQLGQPTLTACTLLNVNGNNFETNGHVQIDGCTDSMFVNNLLQMYSSGGGTGALVELVNSSLRNKVSGNMGRKLSGATLDYGVSLASGCDNNTVTDNDLAGCWDTGAVLDSGTGNATTAVNR